MASMPIEELRLETHRLILRAPRADDLDPWAELMADPEASRFIGGPVPRAVTWRALMTMIGAAGTCRVVNPGTRPALGYLRLCGRATGAPATRRRTCSDFSVPTRWPSCSESDWSAES